jgi:hypothetical protein
MIRALVALAITAASAPGAAPMPKAKPDPKISSIYPFAARRGSTFQATVRGSDLAKTRSVIFERDGLEARVLGVDEEPPAPGERAGKDLLRLQVTVAPGVAAGRQEFRVLTARGISNKDSLDIVVAPVLPETEVSGSVPFPVVVNGRIAHPGESDEYWIEPSAGETLTFEAISGAPGFDPSVTLYEPSGSWFDPQRLNLMALNDEPLYFPGLSTDARLVHRFARSGKYCLKVQGFSGQGGADSVYALHIARGERPPRALRPALKPAWDERQFTRALAADYLQELARRGAAAPMSAPEIFRAAPEGALEAPAMTTLGIVEGRILRPAETHVIRIKVEKPQELAIEVETPEATLPRFNPVVRLLEPGGREIATNVYTKLNNNGLYMMKMIRPKTTVSLSSPGEYKMAIREITTGGAAPDFLYRVLVRPQIPHAGKVEVNEDHINLEAGTSSPLTVLVEREEDFAGYVAIDVEGLPAGVTALPALENPIEKPPLPNGGRLERYTPREQRMAVMLVAAADAPPGDAPSSARVAVRILKEGRLLEPIGICEIPVIVVPRGAS